MVDWTEILLGVIGIIITGVLVPVGKQYYNKIQSDKDQSELLFWADKAVRWAKQVLWDESGEKKKQEVVYFLAAKFDKLGIDIDYEDLDKLIEGVYESVKKEKSTAIPSVE